MHIRDALLFPLHLAAVATGAKSFRHNPVIGSETLNARGLHTARLKIAERMARSKRRRLAHLLDQQQQARFDRDGFVIVNDVLSQERFANLAAEVEKTCAAHLP